MAASRANTVSIAPPAALVGSNSAQKKMTAARPGSARTISSNCSYEATSVTGEVEAAAIAHDDEVSEVPELGNQSENRSGQTSPAFGRSRHPTLRRHGLVLHEILHRRSIARPRRPGPAARRRRYVATLALKCASRRLLTASLHAWAAIARSRWLSRGPGGAQGAARTSS